MRSRAARREVVQERGRQALRGPRRGHQPQVAVLDHQPDGDVPPGVGAVDHAQAELREADADAVEVDRVLDLARESAVPGCRCSRRAAGRARSTSCRAGSRPRRWAGTCRRPRSSARPPRRRPGCRARTIARLRSAGIGRRRLKPPTPRENRSGRSPAKRWARSALLPLLSIFVSRIARSTPLASMSSSSSASSGLRRKELPALKVSSLTRIIHSGGSASPMSTFTRQSIALVMTTPLDAGPQDSLHARWTKTSKYLHYSQSAHKARIDGETNRVQTERGLSWTFWGAKRRGPAAGDSARARTPRPAGAVARWTRYRSRSWRGGEASLFRSLATRGADDANEVGVLNCPASERERSVS